MLSRSGLSFMSNRGSIIAHVRRKSFSLGSSKSPLRYSSSVQDSTDTNSNDYCPFLRANVEIEVNESTTPIQKYILNLNPSNNTLIEKVKCTEISELNSKIEHLQESQERYWSHIPLQNRVSILRSAFRNAFDSEDLNNSNKDFETQLAQLISTEMGKTIQESTDEVQSIVQMKNDVLDFIHDANRPIEISCGNAGGENNSGNATTTILMRDPLGVIAVLAPWNFPAGEQLLHILPALVAGNAVIVKPSELTPLTGKFIVERLREYTFTYGNDGILHKLPIDIVQGDKEIGHAIVQHPKIHSISMTGSSIVGKQLLRNSSFPHNIKRLILELGGKDPMIVFEDADIELAAKNAVIGSTYNAGQVCCSVERIYVDYKVKQQFEQLCIKECEKIHVGPWHNANSTMGPMVSAYQMNRVKTQVDDAVSSGAKVLFTGPMLLDENQNKKNGEQAGNYYPATILTNLSQAMDITHNETFGPVIAIYDFDGSETKAIDLANDSEYGLSASVYSRDIEKAARVASNIRAGQVTINTWVMSGDIEAPLECPWVGHKDSGFGYHSGIEGYKQFSLPKSILMAGSNEGKVKTSHLGDILMNDEFKSLD